MCLSNKWTRAFECMHVPLKKRTFHMCLSIWVVQNHMYRLHMTVYLMKSLHEVLYKHEIQYNNNVCLVYVCMCVCCVCVCINDPGQPHAQYIQGASFANQTFQPFTISATLQSFITYEAATERWRHSESIVRV